MSTQPITKDDRLTFQARLALGWTPTVAERDATGRPIRIALTPPGSLTTTPPPRDASVLGILNEREES